MKNIEEQQVYKTNENRITNTTVLYHL